MIGYDELLHVVKNESDLEEFLTREKEYEYIYNYSLIRQNLLEWFEFDSDAKLLEIGAECGALSDLFCRKVKEVVALDDDEKKCEINKARNSKHDNITIISDIDSYKDKNEKFDYVTVIGGFEIGKMELAKKYIKDGGTLIIATDNKYGIKNWSGMPDGNTGEFFDSIEGYNDKEIDSSYSKKSLEKIIKEAGFKEVDFYYPVPDYIFPMEIYSQEYLPKNGSIMVKTPSYKKERYEVFDEVKAINTICDDGMYEQFANSFLVICK